jgi:hypothetical protein
LTVFSTIVIILCDAFKRKAFSFSSFALEIRNQRKSLTKANNLINLTETQLKFFQESFKKKYGCTAI